MSVPIDALLSRLRAAATEDAVLAAAQDALTRGDLIDTVLHDPPAAVGAAEAAETELAGELRSALRRFPGKGGGFHSIGLDPRAIVVTATLSYIRRGGLYLPSELRTLAQDGRIDRVWHAKAALRFVAFVFALRLLLGRLDRADLSAAGYAEQVSRWAERFGGIEVAAPPPVSVATER